MRVREWYSWHFPELVKIVNDNYQYAKVRSPPTGRLRSVWVLCCCCGGVGVCGERGGGGRRRDRQGRPRPGGQHPSSIVFPSRLALTRCSMLCPTSLLQLTLLIKDKGNLPCLHLP